MKRFDSTQYSLQYDPQGREVEFAGRVISYRNLGNVAFGKLQDQEGRIQFVLKKDLAPEIHKTWSKNIKIGDIIRVHGEIWTSSTGEKSILVNKDFELYRRSIHPFPDKWKGIVDPATRLRKRYLDICLDEEYRDVFKIRSKIISTLRSMLEHRDFIEIETPILSAQASGAQAKTFETHHNALDANLHMRIAPETYLKRAVASGFDRVFEIGKNFRNEGMDPSHLQEFTACEWYAAYWDYKDNLEFFDNILYDLIEQSINKNNKFYIETEPEEDFIQYQGLKLKYNKIPTEPFSDVFKYHTGKRTCDVGSAKEIDELFKRMVRPKLIQPIYLIDYPAHMCPLAKRKDDDENIAEQWQLIVNGWELVKCYSELVDPILQRKLLIEQMKQREGGDNEAMMLEEDFLECMEYGMSPMSGLGIGIDRFVALLTNQTSLRDVVMFPILL